MYISHGKSPREHLERIQAMVNAGCPWVQLRMKDTPFQSFLETATYAKAICKDKAWLTINDKVEIAQFLQTDGVHLGKQDMAPSEARKLLGGKAIIGGTANSYSDIEGLVKEGVNYVGLGPYRFTVTKEKLSPVLGKEGYHSILNRMEKANIYVPVFAIGGIKEEDVPGIIETGVYGIAVSGWMNEAENKKETIEHLHKMLEPSRHI